MICNTGYGERNIRRRARDVDLGEISCVGGRNHALAHPASTPQSGANVSCMARQNCAFGVPEGDKY